MFLGNLTELFPSNLGGEDSQFVSLTHFFKINLKTELLSNDWNVS